MSLNPAFDAAGLLALILALHDLAVVRMSLRTPPGSTVRISLSSGFTMQYTAGGTPRPGLGGDGRGEDEDGDQGGDGRPDFEEFVARTYGYARRIAYDLAIGRMFDGEDAVHDVYAKLQREWGRYSRKPESELRAILTRAIRNQVVEQLRKEERAMRAHTDWARVRAVLDGPDPVRGGLHPVLARIWGDLLLETAGVDRRVIELYFTRRLTRRDIAAATGASRWRVRRAVEQAVRELLSRLDAAAETDPELRDALRTEARDRRPRPRRRSVHDEEAGQ
ncbi:RNA polymerase sigma factor [Actinomadura chibensis]|nr:sigma-70 family RNA polymerase sigma factor [Actinomadura chibensis]